MNDRKLLEAAAKAAGYQWRWFGANFCIEGNPTIRTFKFWNPLTDDGDAMRLAVKLEITIQQSCSLPELLQSIECFHAADSDSSVFEEVLGSDPCAATRRAIVRAAAAIAQSNDRSEP